MFKCNHDLYDIKSLNLQDFENLPSEFYVFPTLHVEATCSKCDCVVRDHIAIGNVEQLVVRHLQTLLKNKKK